MFLHGVRAIDHFLEGGWCPEAGEGMGGCFRHFGFEAVGSGLIGVFEELFETRDGLWGWGCIHCICDEWSQKQMSSHSTQ